jgi:flavorubredoxin
MKARKIDHGVWWVGAVDWDRRLFDCLIPLPDGTSYNAYFVQGSAKSALIDTVDPAKKGVLFERLKDLKVSKIDYVVANHAEQDHSGSIPDILSAYPMAQVVTSDKGKTLLMDLLSIREDRIVVVKDGESLDLGGKTLQFIYGSTGRKPCSHGFPSKKFSSPVIYSGLILLLPTSLLQTNPPSCWAQNGIMPKL